MTGKQRKNKIRLLRIRLKRYELKLADLLAKCKHKIISQEGAAVCDICGEYFGWYCSKSPDKVCDTTFSFDECRYCGQPDERK